MKKKDQYLDYTPCDPAFQDPRFIHLSEKVPTLGVVGLGQAGKCESEYRSTNAEWRQPREPFDPPKRKAGKAA